jgi:hypothetical protein
MQCRRRGGLGEFARPMFALGAAFIVVPRSRDRGTKEAPMMVWVLSVEAGAPH